MNDVGITLLLTIKLAFFTTLVLLMLGIPIAYYLAYSSSKLKLFLHACITLPLVLPPTVIGYYLLVAFSPASGLGQFLDEYLNIQLAFSFNGILIGSIVYSLPFMVQPIEAGLSSLPLSIKEASYSLGKGRLETIIKVLLPSIKPALVIAIVLTFAHTLGEFGIVLMIGGSIPGETKVASIAIFNEVEALNYSVANKYSLFLFLLSFFILFIVYYFNHRRQQKFQ